MSVSAATAALRAAVAVTKGCFAELYSDNFSRAIDPPGCVVRFRGRADGNLEAENRWSQDQTVVSAASRPTEASVILRARHSWRFFSSRMGFCGTREQSAFGKTNQYQ